MYRVIRLKLLELPSQLLQHAGIAHGVPQQVGLVQQTARLLALRFQRLGAGDEVFVLVLMFTMKRNEWIVCLSIAAVLELYTAFRIPQELEKEKR